MTLAAPTITWLGDSHDYTPSFDVNLGEPGSVIAGQILHSEYTTSGGSVFTDYIDRTLTVSDLVDLAFTVSGAALGGGAFQFRFRVESDTENGDWSDLEDVILVGSSGGGVDQFSRGDVDRLRRTQEKLKEASESRSKDKGERARKLRDAVEEVYDKFAGIAPAAAAKVAAIIPATARVTETIAGPDTGTPAIDWSKVTATQIAKVIATMDAYAAQLETEQRQQAIARADAARHQDEDDIETLLMSIQ